MRGSRWAAPLLLVAMVAGAGLAAASVIYEADAGSHGGHGITPLVLWIDTLGAGLALLFAWQIALGYGFFSAARRQMALHRVAAWGVAAVVALHGAGATYHAVLPPREPAPLVLVAIGLALAAGVVWQAWAGQRSRRDRVRSARHVAIGIALTVVAVAHVALGTVHAITG